MIPRIITPVGTEVVTLAEAKAQLRVAHANDDALITALIPRAREAAEFLTKRAIGSRGFQLLLDAWPEDDAIPINRPPYVSDMVVEYVGVDGVVVTMSGSAWYLDTQSEPAWLLPAYNTNWPEARASVNAIRVAWTAGYTAATVPATLKGWMLAYIGDLYENREITNVGNIVTPYGFADALIGPWVVPEAG